MAQKGFPTVMSAHFGNNGSFAYRDTVSALGITWEPVKYADEWSAPSFTYPATEAEISPAKIKIKEITKIGIAVKNLEETMKNYWNLLSIGPWDALDCRPPRWHGQTYCGKSTNHTVRFDHDRASRTRVDSTWSGGQYL